MRAWVRKRYGDSEELALADIPVPIPRSGEVLIKIHAFGVNRADIYMREGLFGEVAPVSGIECAGEVAEDPTGRLAPGHKVVALMGGMGRVRNGSYADYTCVPLGNVFRIETGLSWQDLAAIPESYATAWSCLIGVLGVAAGQTLLVRGGASALGQAAINIARHAGLTVFASTRSAAKTPRLTSLGASHVFIESDDLGEAVRETCPNGMDNVLDLIGNSTLHDSIFLTKKGGGVCMAGFLGGTDPVLFDAGSLIGGVRLTSFASYLLGTKDFPASILPMQTLVDHAERGAYQARPAHVFPFERLADAHRLMESNTASGKIVVVREVSALLQPIEREENML